VTPPPDRHQSAAATALAPSRYTFEIRETCPACAEPRHDTVYASSFTEGPVSAFVSAYYGIDPSLLEQAPYELQRCRTCRLVFQHYVGGPRLLSDLYTHWVEEPEDPETVPGYREEIGNILHSRDAHEIMSAAAFLRFPLQRLKTLDYGMGWALWARIAARLGCDSYGSDLSSPRMEFARRLGIKTVTDDEILQLKFHFVNAEQVFEHVPEPLALLRKLGTALEPGGVVKISVPSGEHVDAQIRTLNSGRCKRGFKSMAAVEPLEHVNCFTRRSIEVMAARAGMEIVRPSIFQSYAFLRHRGTLGLARPRKSVKELVRPWYQYRNPANIYVWLRKSG
jgi:2-polyprenyl-3-methyl-5-hydroxy-6-metoxy-1,4-benzoquinol methylase